MVFTPSVKLLNNVRWHLAFHLDKTAQIKKTEAVALPMKPGGLNTPAVKMKQREGCLSKELCMWLVAQGTAQNQP